MTHPIDLDSESVQFDGHWYTRDDLARRIKSMLDAGDFAVTRPSQALEELTGVLASLRTLAFRALPEMGDALNSAAASQGKTVGAVVREAVAAFLAMPVAPGPAKPIPLQAKAPEPAAAPTAAASKAPPNLAPAKPVVPEPVTPASALSVPEAPSVVVDRSAIVTEEAGQGEGAEAVDLTSKKKEEEAVERRWFGG